MSQSEIDIERYKVLAVQKQSEHRRFLSQLKLKPPKNLDKLAVENPV